MRDLLEKEYIFLDEDLQTRREVFQFLSEKSFKLGLTDNEKAVEQSLIDREKQASTGLLDGIAIPHAISSAIKIPAILFVRTKNALHDWQTIDHSDVTQVITMLVPENGEQKHLQTLANLSGELVDEEQRKGLAECSCVDDVYNFLNQKSLSN